MNRLIRIFVFFTLFALGIAPFCGASPSLMPPLMEDLPRPPVETATFEGVTPGKTSLEQLTRLWGDPRLETVSGGQVVRAYSFEPLNHIEVTVQGGIVRSILIQLDAPYPEEEARAALQSELLRSKPVLIPDESGEIYGQVFPERGMMFLFARQTPGQMGYFVQQIAIEPVTAEPFVLRAEAMLYDQPTESRRDLLDALRLKPDYAKAYWLLAQVDLMEGHVESALLYNEKAIQLDEQRPAYHLTFVQALIRMNRVGEAKQYLHETIGICDRFPHEMARALMMLGDLYRTSQQADNELALDCHTKAIALATTLFNHSNPTIRLTARDVLFESHLATAKAIAWGRYDNQEEVIKKWLDRARVLARDSELVRAPRYSREYSFKIAATTLSTLVAVPGKMNIDIYIEDVLVEGRKLIESAHDPILLAKYHWDTSIALYDAVQIFQLREQYSSALKYGEEAAKYMKIGLDGRSNDTDLYLLGRLYFRLGAIHASGNGNHRAAIEWFDRAKPIFEKLLPKIDADALGVFGVMLVSMGVSYWETDQREEAVRLTERGCQQIERGVRANVVDSSKLWAPYSNLAKMYSEMGDRGRAADYARRAESVNPESAKLR